MVQGYTFLQNKLHRVNRSSILFGKVYCINDMFLIIKLSDAHLLYY